MVDPMRLARDRFARYVVGFMNSGYILVVGQRPFPDLYDLVLCQGKQFREFPKRKLCLHLIYWDNGTIPPPDASGRRQFRPCAHLSQVQTSSSPPRRPLDPTGCFLAPGHSDCRGPSISMPASRFPWFTARAEGGHRPHLELKTCTPRVEVEQKVTDGSRECQSALMSDRSHLPVPDASCTRFQR
ncbi:hypothetical protein BJ508DRAFT_306876 [Ascobolus immersus RN42]|uniref:Uncharacterized protein n=1 Tax=Ascobolus immersus RN42 TaxID=1160509 RepID=A0A3N4I517_ASCIM|nr:hypothetical protein BJ508DRAFT_306876 [Ascobolus immersus RN42]